MGTPLMVVYEAFLALISADEWALQDDLEIVQQDWLMLLRRAIFRFKFPRVSLLICCGNEFFLECLSQSEIQVLATYMRSEWIKRCLASWENIRQLYSNKDFSQANHLDKLIKLSAQVEEECAHMYAVYDRARDGKPSGFSGLAGGK